MCVWSVTRFPAFHRPARGVKWRPVFPLPVLAWVALPLGLGLALRRRGFFRLWGASFALLIALDAYLTGALSPLPASSGSATFAAVAFVILGDLRVFLAAEHGEGRAGALRAIGMACVTPLVTQALRAALPRLEATPRLTYLAYEVVFLAVLGGWTVLRGRRLRLGRPLAAFVGLQYGLWATIDVALLLSSATPGWLRHIPDLLYYVVFVPWVLTRVRDDE